MNIPYPNKYTFDAHQYTVLCSRFSSLMSQDYNYGTKSSVEKLLFSILIDTANKFQSNGFMKPQKRYTKTLKYHEAFALLSFITYLLPFEKLIYERTLLDQVRTMLDKKVQ